MPTLTSVSEAPSVSLQPEGHLVRSIVKPSGPVTLVPSADLPHLLSLMRCSMAARSLAQSASHSAIDVGWAAGVEPAEPPPAAVVVEPPPSAFSTPDFTPGSLVAADDPPPLLSSPPHAVAKIATASALAPMSANRPRTVPPVYVRC